MERNHEYSQFMQNYDILSLSAFQDFKLEWQRLQMINIGLKKKKEKNTARTNRQLEEYCKILQINKDTDILLLAVNNQKLGN